jgi:hypothetical protein
MSSGSLPANRQSYHNGYQLSAIGYQLLAIGITRSFRLAAGLS